MKKRCRQRTGQQNCFGLRVPPRVNLLAEKPEKSLRFSFLAIGTLKKEWEIQNWEKGSLTSETIFPLVILASALLARILSIKMAELLYTRVGLSIVGVKE